MNNFSFPVSFLGCEVDGVDEVPAEGANVGLSGDSGGHSVDAGGLSGDARAGLSGVAGLAGDEDAGRSFGDLSEDCDDVPGASNLRRLVAD